MGQISPADQFEVSSLRIPGALLHWPVAGDNSSSRCAFIVFLHTGANLKFRVKPSPGRSHAPCSVP